MRDARIHVMTTKLGSHLLLKLAAAVAHLKRDSHCGELYTTLTCSDLAEDTLSFLS